MFPASISHTIRRHGTPSRFIYQISYLYFLLEFYLFIRSREKAHGATFTLLLLIIGSLHIFVPIPEPSERISNKNKAELQEMIHYGSAGLCVVALGYGFSQSSSTRWYLKLFYYLSCLGLGVSLHQLGPNGREDDDSSPETLPLRLAFMISEYCTFLSGSIAIAFPKVMKHVVQ